ncbi:hypothetical protein [Candidatus Accumulibacter sp. ACC012]|uniref:hypothetical protein n=1 Tax=Candidatus Accumulibacter sp. ACC012 TaxID=2823332 RepID=UPI0034446A01
MEVHFRIDSNVILHVCGECTMRPARRTDHGNPDPLFRSSEEELQRTAAGCRSARRKEPQGATTADTASSVRRMIHLGQESLPSTARTYR